MDLKVTAKMAKKAGEEMTDVVLRWAKSSWEDTINLEHDGLHVVHEIWSVSICWGYMLMEEEGADNIDYYMALETHVDMEASTLMALSGFYRHANLILRGWVELTFLGLWFHNSSELYEKWLENAPDAPFKRRGYVRERWLRQLLSEASFRDFNLEYDLADEVLNLFGELSKATHAKGKEIHETRDRGDSVTRFRKDSFEQWFLNLYQVFDVTSTALFLRYPHLFKSQRKEAVEVRETLSKSKLEQLKAFLTQHEKSFKIANKNSQTKKGKWEALR